PIFDTRRALTVERHPRRGRARQYGQVGTIDGRSQIADRRAVAQPIARRVLQVERAFVAAVVIVVELRVPSLTARGHKRVGQCIEFIELGAVYGTAAAAYHGIAFGIILETLEYRQHVRITPPSAAFSIPPRVVFLGIAAHEQIAVDRARAADHATARPLLGLAVEVHLR